MQAIQIAIYLAIERQRGGIGQLDGTVQCRAISLPIPLCLEQTACYRRSFLCHPPGGGQGLGGPLQHQLQGGCKIQLALFVDQSPRGLGAQLYRRVKLIIQLQLQQAALQLAQAAIKQALGVSVRRGLLPLPVQRRMGIVGVIQTGAAGQAQLVVAVNQAQVAVAQVKSTQA